MRKIKGTHTKATTDPNYTTFLKNFGEFTVAKLDKKEVSSQEFILEEIKALRRSFDKISVPPPSVPSGIQFVNVAPGTGKTTISEYLKRGHIRPNELYILEEDAPKKRMMASKRGNRLWGEGTQAATKSGDRQKKRSRLIVAQLTAK